MYKNENQELDTICPSCQIGRIHEIKRPYLEIHHGHLFTIPQALCYVCDVCDFSEFDIASIELMSNMIVEATSRTIPVTEESAFQPPAKSDDDLPKKPIQPSASS